MIQIRSFTEASKICMPPANIPQCPPSIPDNPCHSRSGPVFSRGSKIQQSAIVSAVLHASQRPLHGIANFCRAYLGRSAMHGVISTSDQGFVSSQPILCHPHTQIKHNPFLTMYKETFPIWKSSPSHASRGSSQIAFPIIVLPKDDHDRLRSRGTTGSSMLDNDLGHVCRGRRIQMSGHFRFGMFLNNL